MTMATSAFSISLKVAVTAAEPTFSISAATDEAWQSRVQWSTLLCWKAWRISFWKRYASSFEHLALPKPATALPPWSRAQRRGGPWRRRSIASSQLASRKCVERVRRIDVQPLRRRVVAADQRLRQPVRVGDVVEAEAALDAEPVSFAGPSTPSTQAMRSSLDLVGDLAADAAVGADRAHLAVEGGAVAALGARRARSPPSARRSGRPARTRRRRRRSRRPSGRRCRRRSRSPRPRPAMPITSFDLHLAAGADAEVAVDAGVEVDPHRHVAVVEQRHCAGGRAGKRLAATPCSVGHGPEVARAVVRRRARAAGRRAAAPSPSPAP